MAVMTYGEIIAPELVGKHGDEFWLTLLSVAKKNTREHRERIPENREKHSRIQAMVDERIDDPMPKWELSKDEWLTLPRNVRAFIWRRLIEHEQLKQGCHQ